MYVFDRQRDSYLICLFVFYNKHNYCLVFFFLTIAQLPWLLVREIPTLLSLIRHVLLSVF